MKDNFYALLVLSCDRYNWLWDAFFKRFDSFWPDKDIKKYILTNHLSCKWPLVQTIDIGADVDWSTNLLNAIERIDEDYIFVTFEDVFINADVNPRFLNSLKKFVFNNKVEYLNTKANPMPKGKSIIAEVIKLNKGMHYRASLANAFWKKETLKSLLLNGESPWDFERNASCRSNALNEFYGTSSALISFDHIVVGGKLTRQSADLSDIRSIDHPSKFPVMGVHENILFNIKVIRNQLFSKIIPTFAQQRIRNAFK